MKLINMLIGAVCTLSVFSCTAPAQQEVKADEGNNAVIETIMTRRSVRKYQPQAVNRDTMQVIVECGINAPKAINRQAWEIRIVDNPEVIQRLINTSRKWDSQKTMICCFASVSVIRQKLRKRNLVMQRR